MFFPLLRSKRHEVQAVKAVAAGLLHAGNVLPIFEPVAKDAWKNFKDTLDAGLTLALITNPMVGMYSIPRLGEQRVPVPMPLRASAAFNHVNAIWAFLISDGTRASEVRAFTALRPGRKMFVVTDRPRATGNDDPIAPAVESRPDYFVVCHHAINPEMPRDINVDLEDAFQAQPVNIAYPADEFYSQRHITIANDLNYAHFGDYSIVGRLFRKGGGQANNVALHHVYTVGPRYSDLRIKHYVSQNDPDVATMWYDALTQLINDLPNLRALSPLNDTAVLQSYQAMYQNRAFPGLGMMKEFALRHHLLLMTTVQ
jgi:hypothetical protein